MLKQVKCILSAIKIKETSYVMNFQVDEDTVTKSVDDTDDLDVCIKGNADYTGDPGVNSYEATLKSGCAADETGSSTATSEGIPATQYFIDEEKKLQNPGSNQSDSNTGQTPSPTTGNAANNAECTSRWDQAPASTYCKATATYKTGTIWGMSGGTFHCELSAVDCSITVTIDEGRDGAITETDYTLTHSNAGPVSYAPDKLSRLLLCVLLDFNEPTSGYKATLPVAVNAPACNQMGVGGYDQNWVENYNLPEVHTEDD